MSNDHKNLRREALLYHSQGRPGKIEVVPTKPYSSQYDLSLAYSPGVAEPCREIEKNPEEAYKYTDKGNLVAVISNGTAVLGLGDIGPLAGKPVMEGKALLFKTFADIDVFDIELDSTDVETFISTVRNIAPTFGGINLEDIKAPECFEIEKRLKEELDIPVMHDDQHGTAIISAAALLNALEITGRKIEETKVVVNGAGAAAISCARLYRTIGIRPENMVMCDSKGVVSVRRSDLNEAKKEFATQKKVDTLGEAIVEADVFLGLSVAGVLSQEMVRSMAPDPIVMALANPDPEITYEEAVASRPDIIFATGRSDYPNQVNNVLGFPYIFRGALDVRASTINEQMKIAAAHALARLAREPVPESVSMAYGNERITFGREYLIPKPLDPRLVSHISAAVAEAAVESGVARHQITDWEEYKISLEHRMGRDNKLLRRVRMKVANSASRRVIFSEGESANVLRAAVNLAEEGLIIPVVTGSTQWIREILAEEGLDGSMLEIFDITDPREQEGLKRYASLLYRHLNRSGLTWAKAEQLVKRSEWLAQACVAAGDADIAIIGYGHNYRGALQPVRSLFSRPGCVLAAMHILTTKRGPMFFADTAVNTDPSAQTLADIACLAADTVRELGVEPVVAMLSHSNFGSDDGTDAAQVAEAVRILHRTHPQMVVDGEMKADMAFDGSLRERYYPFNRLGAMNANVFIFPNLAAANITARMMSALAGGDLSGPLLLGLETNVYLQPRTAAARDIYNLTLLAAALADRT